MIRKFVIAMLILALVYLQGRLWIGAGSLAEWVTQKDNLERLKTENARLYHKNRLLIEEVLELQQGFETVEEKARQDLGMIRSDETFFLIYD